LINRIKKKKDLHEQEEEKSCIFKPEISTKIEPAQPPEITSIKGVNKFFERQKIASEARKEKEMLLRRDIGANWSRKITVPTEFNFASATEKTKNKEWRKDSDSPPSSKKGASPNSKVSEKIQAPTEAELDFEKARRDLHKSIQELQI